MELELHCDGDMYLPYRPSQNHLRLACYQWKNCLWQQLCCLGQKRPGLGSFLHHAWVENMMNIIAIVGNTKINIPFLTPTALILLGTPLHLSPIQGPTRQIGTPPLCTNNCGNLLGSIPHVQLPIPGSSFDFQDVRRHSNPNRRLRATFMKESLVSEG